MEPQTKVDLGIARFTVMSITIDYAFTLKLARPKLAVHGQAWANLRIGVPFEGEFEGVGMWFDVEQHREELGPALKLFALTIDTATTAEDGSLAVTFSDGSSIRVPSNPAYEAWECTHSDGRHVICIPGGELAIWPAHSETAA